MSDCVTLLQASAPAIGVLLAVVILFGNLYLALWASKQLYWGWRLRSMASPRARLDAYRGQDGA